MQCLMCCCQCWKVLPNKICGGCSSVVQANFKVDLGPNDAFDSMADNWQGICVFCTGIKFIHQLTKGGI